MLISSAISVFYTKQANEATQRANTAIDEVNRLILEGRQIGNIRGNVTLGAVSEVLEGIEKVEHDILSNLTSHRVVTNQTRDNLNTLISGFNQTNEDGRAEAVNEIINAVNNNTKLLEQLLDHANSFDTSGSIATFNEKMNMPPGLAKKQWLVSKT